jgi:nucleotide-binding universal stress UspA family protein
MRILFATDGSDGATAGATFLKNLPLTEEDSITLLTVLQSEERKTEGQRILDPTQKALGPTRAKLRRYVRYGNAAEEIIDAISQMAEEVPTDLVMVGTRGITGIARFFLGSVAERVARFAPCPVLVANHVRGPLKQIVIGYDGSRSARRAVGFIEKLPLTPDCEICVATMVTPKEAGGFLPGPMREEIEAFCKAERRAARQGLTEMEKQLQASGRKVVTELRDADPAAGLLQVASERKADLLVVGAQGISEVEQFLLGSVSDKVLRHAPCSVMIVRPFLEEN